MTQNKIKKAFKKALHGKIKERGERQRVNG